MTLVCCPPFWMDIGDADDTRPVMLPIFWAWASCDGCRERGGWICYFCGKIALHQMPTKSPPPCLAFTIHGRRTAVLVSDPDKMARLRLIFVETSSPSCTFTALEYSTAQHLFQVSLESTLEHNIMASYCCCHGWKIMPRSWLSPNLLSQAVSAQTKLDCLFVLCICMCAVCAVRSA